MRILILSAYNAMSHDSLNKGLIRHLPEAEFKVLALPPRYFAWRTRGNSLSFAFENRAELTERYDAVFATSLTDVTALRGFVPELAGIPLAVYFHENQFAYPDNSSAHGILETKIVSLYNALAADRIAFNTAYNMHTFLDGAEKLLKKMPDHVPAGLIEMIRKKSRVINVPVEPGRRSAGKDRPVILWNHRWEYDKGPDRFLEVLRELDRRGFDFGLHLAGQVFRNVPQAFEDIRNAFSDRILSYGFAESRAEYEKILADSNIAISTSLHDFQGLSVIEAADAGCIPVLPDRLAYPELFPAENLYCGSEDVLTEARSCADAVVRLWHDKRECSMERFYWENLKKNYLELLTF